MTTESKSRIPLPRNHEMSVGYSQLFCASLLLLGILAGCSSKEEKPVPPPPGVTVTPVVRKDVDIKQEWVGTMLGNVDAEIRPKVEGFLLTQLYSEGSYVQKGKPLFQLDQRQAKAAVQQAEGGTVKSFQDTLDIFQHRFEGGAASGLEVARAQAALSNVAAVIPDLRRQITAQEVALNFLLGHNPGPISRGSALTEQFDPPEVPTGLPSQLLERRPDLREAEETLVAANANVGVAKANFFPTISLTGVFGGVSPQLSELTGTGKAWSLGGNLAGPLFTAGRLKNEYRASLAQRDQAKIAFEKNVTQAFGEVSTSLSAHQELAKSYEEQLRSIGAYRESVRLSLIRYDSGLANYLEIIDAEIQMYPAERSAINYDLGRKVALVDLYRSLGGWNLNDSQWVSGSGTIAPPQTPP